MNQTFSDQNPYGPRVDLYRTWKDIYFILGQLPDYAQACSQYLNVVRKAKVWEMCSELSRPIEWNGGH